jgi:hypothetical protein
VPKSIQDLIERNIRTLSNSLSTAKSKSAVADQTGIDTKEEREVKIEALNKALLESA